MCAWVQETVVVLPLSPSFCLFREGQLFWLHTYLLRDTQTRSGRPRAWSRAMHKPNAPTHQPNPLLYTLHTHTHISNSTGTVIRCHERRGRASAQYSCGNSHCRNCLTYVMNEPRTRACMRTPYASVCTCVCVRTLISQYTTDTVWMYFVALCRWGWNWRSLLGFSYIAVSRLTSQIHTRTHADILTTLPRSPSVRAWNTFEAT